jgi:hypothetical protein
MRQTSILAYEAVKASGKLSDMRWRVYDFLYKYGPLTGRELDAKMASPNETRTSYHKRLSELERMGLAYIVAERICSITGHQAIEWDVTGAMESGTLDRKSVSKYTKLVRAIRELALSHPEGIPVGLVLVLLENQVPERDR